MSIYEDYPEVRKMANVNQTKVRSKTNLTEKILLGCERFSRFSTWSSLQRAIAILIMFVRRFKSRKKMVTAPEEIKPKFTSAEIFKQAEHVIISSVQAEHFTNELNTLNSEITITPHPTIPM